MNRFENYPARLNDEKELIYTFELMNEVFVDAESEEEAEEVFSEITMREAFENDGEPIYLDGIPKGTQRYSFYLYGQVEVAADYREEAKDSFMRLTMEEAMEKGMSIE